MKKLKEIKKHDIVVCVVGRDRDKRGVGCRDCQYRIPHERLDVKPWTCYLKINVRVFLPTTKRRRSK